MGKKTAKSRNYAHTTRKAQRGGLFCDRPETHATPDWDRNSCYLDSTLIALLHGTQGDFLQNKLQDIASRALVRGRDAHSKSVITTTVLLSDLTDTLNGITSHTDVKSAIQQATEIRNDLRLVLGTCPNPRNPATASVINQSEQLDLDDFLGELQYALSVEPKKPRMEDWFIQDATPNGQSVVSLIPTDVNQPIDVEASLLEHPENIQDCPYGFLPVKVSRVEGGMKYNFHVVLSDQPFAIGEHTYQLKSLVVHGGTALAGHYFCYLRCQDDIGNFTDEWIQYNDMGDTLSKQGKFSSWYNPKDPKKDAVARNVAGVVYQKLPRTQ